MRYFVLLMITAAGLLAADATGSWTGTLTPEGKESGPALLVLKQEGSTLTGTAGPDAGERHPIEKGKVENGNLTFEVPSGEVIMKFALKQEGDEITGTIT